MTNLSIIVAIDQQMGIGKESDLLLPISEDLKRFKSLTTGHTMIMGRKTLFTLPKWPLPNRRHVVITRDTSAQFDGCTVVHSPQEAMQNVKGEKETFIIGGGEIYKAMLPYAQKLYLTKIHHSMEADTFFPTINWEEWEELENTTHTDPRSGYDYSFVTLQRK